MIFVLGMIFGACIGVLICSLCVISGGGTYDDR